VVNGRSPERVAVTTARLAGEGLTVAGIPADVSHPGESRRLVRETLERFGRLDVLVNNAGLAMRAPLTVTGADAAWRLIATNLGGALFPTLAALELAAATLSSITFVSSLAGLYGIPSVACYGATKAALTALAEALQGELRGTGVHVGVCYPGFTENDPEKRFVSPDGGLQPVGHNYRYRRTQRQTAAWILRSIRRRRFKSVQTFPGRLIRPLSLLAPWVLRGVYRRGIDRIH